LDAAEAIQGSHFAHLKQACAANSFVLDRRVDPCRSEVFFMGRHSAGHTKMWKNQHAPGNMAVLVNAPTTGLRTIAGSYRSLGKQGRGFKNQMENAG